MPTLDRPAAAGTLPGSNVSVFLRRSAQVAPTSVAVAHVDGDLSYRQLLERASHVAGLLPPAASGPEPILVVTEHDAATPELYFGVLMAGHAVVPVSARLPAAVIAQIAAMAGARLGLLAPSAAPRQVDLAETIQATRWVTHPADALEGALPDSVSTLPEHTAMVAFTSGTTGKPKGVIVTHGNLIANGFIIRVFRA